jgi:endonuclease YncB( thermonuclease family)
MMDKFVSSAALLFAALALTAGCGHPNQPAPVAAMSAEQEMTPNERVAYGPGFNVDEANRTVTKVIDGDTFDIDTGQRIRVLGIDSCEMSTKGGAEAKATATDLLSGGVALRSVPGGPDKDRYGRLLRYVQVTSGDFGELMVAYDHTGVYAGKNDAEVSYMDNLRKLDPGGRNCAGAAVASAPSDNTYVPVPHGDNHKSRFCSRHWYC